jgi:hypothetical protein
MFSEVNLVEGQSTLGYKKRKETGTFGTRKAYKKTERA